MVGKHPGQRLTDVLSGRAHATPDALAYEFASADGAVASLTYEQLAERAAAVAGLLRERRHGTRAAALLLFPPGLEFVVALWGCLVAGISAIPAYPPEIWKPDVGFTRLRRVVADAQPRVALCAEGFDDALRAGGAAEGLETLTLNGEVDGPTEAFPAPEAEAVALVQYTSGSTSAPKGVALTHANLEHNTAAIASLFGLDEGAKGVIWLPPYHDMGLIGGILTPMQAGIPVRLFSPLDFLRSPLMWLRQISDTGGTVSGGPNFAYDLCVRRRIDDDELAELDLSRWKVAFNGAEPVRWRTLETFAQKFEPAGFSRSAFFPCYGLAEATLIVSGRHWVGSAVVGRRRVPVTELDDASSGAEHTRVSCGAPLPDQKVAIVDPESLEPLPPGAEGEIWLRGPSVARGYWGASEGEAFGMLGSERYLRTGDYGFLLEAELVITGRRSDLIVHRGVNYHPADVEEAAVEGAPGLRPVAAAFAVEADPEDEIVLVLEARTAEAPKELARAARERVLAATGLRPSAVVVGRPGAVPRTSSGKVQRAEARRRFLAGAYDDWIAVTDGARLAAAAAPDAPRALVELVGGIFAGVCGAEACGPGTTLFDLGGDSLRAGEAAAILSDALTVDVSVELVLSAQTPRDVARAVAEAWIADGKSLDELEARVERLGVEVAG